jgi:hypothetical protein
MSRKKFQVSIKFQEKNGQIFYALMLHAVRNTKRVDESDNINRGDTSNIFYIIPHFRSCSNAEKPNLNKSKRKE